MPEVIVVTGTTVGEDGSPGIRLSRRMERAVGCLLEHPGTLLLVSGASIGGRASEALVMRDLALAAGIAEERILVERAAASTWENASFSAALLAPLAPSRVALVTDRIHLPRARLAFHAHGLPVSAIAADWPDRRTPRATVLAALGYELLATSWYLARLALGRPGGRPGQGS